MSRPETRRVAAIDGAGQFVLVEEPVPEPAKGEVLVENRASLISPGTELGRVKGRRANPDPEAPPTRFGYSSAGVVIQAGPGCDDLPPGTELACMGSGYALHSDYVVVPRNLTVPKPPELSFEEASFVHLAATALHAVRRADVRIGENFLVVGLGLLGQLAVQLGRTAGAHVAAMDFLPMRRSLAARGGAELVLDPHEEPAEQVREFTRGAGLDCALIAFGGDATEAVELVSRMMKLAPDTHRMGRLAIVGGAQFQSKGWPVAVGNMDIRPSSRPGPGYHDEEWEHGRDYPDAFVRWTTRRNMEEVLRLAADGRLDLEMLVTHRLPLDDFAEGAEALVSSPGAALGVVLKP
jgi:2-desacetyl-2-hydroxyethyl bacteriochlorophyllide A dehydrogenase